MLSKHTHITKPTHYDIHTHPHTHITTLTHMHSHIIQKNENHHNTRYTPS